MLKPCHLFHLPFVYLSVSLYLYAEHTLACMHTQYRELPASAPLLYQSSPCFVALPSPSTAQSSQALGTAWGEQHVWLPGTPKQQQPTPCTHSIYRKHYPAHTQHWIIPFASWIPWMFLLAERQRRQNHDVLWLAFRLVCVCVCMCVSVCVRVCVWEVSLYFFLTMSRCCEQSGVCSMLDSIDMDVDRFWASHWILVSTVPVFPPSLLWQTWAC